MSDEQKHHVYDDIVEHDNPLPTWWLWTFYITIIFSFIYFVHYELAGGPTLKDELVVAMSELEKNKAAQPQVLETEESLKAAFEAGGLLEVGATQYAQKCAACHGNEMQGLIGPNLVDKHWIHGKGSRLEILQVIREGVAANGMPPWGPVMKKDELYAVTAYILSKKGTTPAGAKEPQGELVETY
ncbi:MAG: cbb3-type cytochrome c oxidase N-terminal domain-containing protein [Bdellovibrionia bacterium]